jgi:hypothetical protein
MSDIETTRAFLMWCTIFSGGLLVLAFLIFAYAGSRLYRANTIWYLLGGRQGFKIAVYVYLALYSMLVLVFNLIPYLALVMLG